MEQKLTSLTIFFPFYNDEGTVDKQLEEAFRIGGNLTDDLEVIALIGGKSKDKTAEKIWAAKQKYPNLKVVDKSDNWEGYAVIKYGLASTTKDWVFYTDGDAQYHLEELPLLVEKYFDSKADVINGYKKHRGDGVLRFILGDLYAKISSFLFELPIRDTDCDFRLIRNDFLRKIELVSHDSSILGEMIKKLELVGAKFAEVPVNHYPRIYGKSNYSPLKLAYEKIIGDIKLYFKLKKMMSPQNSVRIFKFGAVGVVSILVQTVLFNVLILISSIHPASATIIADQVAIISSFYLNNKFTFKDRKHINIGQIGKAFLKFYLIVMTTTIVQAFVVYLGVHLFGRNVLVSNLFFIVGLGITFPINYVLQKHNVWGKKYAK